MTPLALPGIPFLAALLATLAGGPPLIAWLASRKSIQPISPDAPEKHRLKHGTPTMGGLLLLLAVAVAVGGSVAAFEMLPTQRVRLLGVLLTFLGAGLIGLIDDLGKARRKQNKAGLSERVKLALQLAVAIGFVALLAATEEPRITTVLFFAGREWDLRLAYYGFAVLYIVGFGNAANFTDGLDGLAAGTTLIAAVALSVCAVASQLFLGVGFFFGAVAGACAGFLWYNAYPARVFMGDTGSLALGMGLAAAATAAKQELLLLVIGVVYLAELCSMMLQRYVFKYRRLRFGLEFAQSHRVFRRAPLHHHFEELGWHETQVVTRFWVAALIAAASGMLLLPLFSTTPGGRP